MKNTFKTLVEQLLSEEEKYRTQIKAEIHINFPGETYRNYDYESSVQVSMTFDINADVKSWGITSLSLVPTYIEPIQLEIQNVTTGDTEKHIQIEVDPLSLKVNTKPPTSYIGFGNMYLVVSPDGRVDYEQSYIQSFGI